MLFTKEMIDPPNSLPDNYYELMEELNKDIVPDIPQETNDCSINNDHKLLLPMDG